MKKLFVSSLAILLLASLVVIVSSRFASGQLSPVAAPVQVLDSNNKMLGIAANPFYFVTGSPADGGTATAPTAVYQGDGGGIANSWAVQVNDGTNVLGTLSHPVVTGGPGTAGTPSTMVNSVQGIAGGTALSNDPVPSDETNTAVVNNTATAAGIFVDAGTRYVLDVNVTNEGTANGWWQLYCGQYALDAGGTAGASTVPNLQVRCGPGAICGTGRLTAPISCAGAAWYSSSTAGVLTTASAPNMTITAGAVR